MTKFMNVELIAPAMENFRNHLVSGFETIKLAYEQYAKEAENRPNDFAATFEDYFHDWAQSNWELLVERVVCNPNESLAIYGTGSDYETDKHSRVFFHNAVPTHEIVCVAKIQAIDWISGKVVDLSKFEFDGFVSTSGEWFDVSAPFDHVLLSEKGVTSNYLQVIVSKEQIEWQVNEI
ncbi:MULTISPECIES: hypothetical protein [Pseudoalteromonas]|uniref:hypothetical protein n=1 Tax=Pseudoalteromonas TaxID=53246 RepID=UPI0019D04168|nr:MULTISPECIES: hypothetical protein [Pseudoalteromonas]MBR8843418.1 hypothetical protein [Pseudoalteromonas sp. JC3]UDM63523.1 hypothetical protein KIJ96_21440 [Pseudoalteromonas piscicida]UDM63861.1 hypothetical protein KIJ96_23285 [Pseudoalteromonas piscicida]WJE11361.1 hypothetical protein QSH61_19750 [Pseudoalteromonas sp. JC3]